MDENQPPQDPTAERRRKQREATRRYRLAHPGQSDSYYRANAERIRQEYREKYKRLKAEGKTYYQLNPERCRKNARLWRQKNRERVSATTKAWAAKNPERRRLSSLHSTYKKRYGTTPEKVAAMRLAQGDRCAICGNAPKGKKNHSRLCVDHDHETGAIRDLLCVRCNAGLGNFQDSVALLEAAAVYLRRHGKDA